MKFSLKRVFAFFVFLLFAEITISFSQPPVPNIGDNRTEIATWNLEWFGHTGSGYGPSNDALQQANIKSVIAAANIDIWAFCEVYDRKPFDTMMKSLPQYSYEIAVFDATQKTALMWKNSLFEKIYSKNILAVYEYYFGGRIPFEVALRNKLTGDTLTCIVIHGKANTGSNSEKLEAYNRRKDGAIQLKNYLDPSPNRKVMLLGDINDDVDVSIYNNLASPYANFVTDTARYLFTTQSLSKANQKSTVSYSSMIDHQLVTKGLKPFYVANSSKVFMLSNYISNYGTSTSDHYPVYSFFDFSKPSTIPQTENTNSSLLYPNPTVKSSTLEFSKNEVQKVSIVNSLGMKVTSITIEKNIKSLLLPELNNGIYFVQITFSNGKTELLKWVVGQN